jgi:hypothetical protein
MLNPVVLKIIRHIYVAYIYAARMYSFLCSFFTLVSVFGPVRVLSQRVNLCCVSLIWMVMQREYTGVYPGSGEIRPYV